MKSSIILVSLCFFFCGSAFSQIYTPKDATVYGSHNLRLKADSSQHIPEKDTLILNTKDSSAQIFLNKIDSSIWVWYKPKGFFKVSVTGGGGPAPTGENGDTTISNKIGWGSLINRNTTVNGNGFDLRLSNVTKIGLNQPSPVAKLDILQNGLHANQQNDSLGILFSNTTSASSTTDSNSTVPIVFSLNARRTVPSGASQNVRFRIDAVGASTSGSVLRITSSINGAAYRAPITLNSNGSLSNVFIDNNAIGVIALGSNNLRFGVNSMNSLTSGSQNIGLGNSFQNITTGSNNIGIGHGALNIGDTMNYSTAVGIEALNHNDSDFNTAIGYHSLFTNNKGYANTGTGVNSLLSNTIGSKNSSFGAGSLENNTTGNFNSFLGEDAGLQITTGSNNSGIGWLAWSADSLGSNNVGIGWSAGRGVISGNNNIAIGQSAAYLDWSGSTQTTNINNSITIGSSALGASNQITLGSDSINKVKVYGIPLGSGVVGLRYNPTTNQITYADTSTGGGATPTFQDVLSSGSTLTTDNSVDANSHEFDITNASIIQLASNGVSAMINLAQSGPNQYIRLQDSILITPYRGKINIDSLRTMSNSDDKWVVWQASSGALGVKSISIPTLDQVLTSGSTLSSSYVIQDAVTGTHDFTAYRFNSMLLGGNNLQLSYTDSIVFDAAKYTYLTLPTRITDSTTQDIQVINRSTGDISRMPAGIIGGLSTTLSNGKFLVGNGSNVATAVTPTGDATFDNTGAFTVTKINGTSLAGLSTGILKNTTTTGVPSIAVAGDFPTLNQNTTGSAAKWTTARTLWGNSVDGTADIATIIASTYGGTGNGFTKFSGPSSSEKIFTLPNATSTILTDNAAVTVAQGGTGVASLTAHNILIGNGTGNTLFLSPSSSGKIVVSNGTDFIMSTPTFPNASATSGKTIRSDGTNWIASTATLSDAPSTSGKILVSDGTNWITSTPTFPNASATSGKMIKSDGTNWVASTETYAAPGTSGNILTSDGTNWTSAAPVVTASSTNTLTNKRWTARVGNTTSSATPTINTDNTDIYKLTAQTVDITSFTTNLSGTPVDGDILEIQITGTAARGITWGASFVSSTVTLPTTTVTTATLTVVLQYFTTSSYGNNKWVCVNSF